MPGGVRLLLPLILLSHGGGCFYTFQELPQFEQTACFWLEMVVLLFAFFLPNNSQSPPVQMIKISRPIPNKQPFFFVLVTDPVWMICTCTSVLPHFGQVMVIPSVYLESETSHRFEQNSAAGYFDKVAVFQVYAPDRSILCDHKHVEHFRIVVLAVLV